MKTLAALSKIFYALVGILGYFFAGIYLFRSEFMPYHAIAVEKPWEEVDAGLQVLIIALMRVSGGGWLATSVAITLFFISWLKQKQTFFGISLVLVALAALIPTLYATLYVKTNSPANPPWLAATAGILILLLGLIFDLISHKKLEKQGH